MLHPLYLALASNTQDIKQKIVCILHDIIEDTDVTEANLLAMHFDKEIVDAIVLLSKPDKMDYLAYVRKLKA